VPRGVKDKAGGTWTNSRYFGFIRSALRRAWSKYPVKYQALNAARRPSQLEDKRTKWEYQCNCCNEWFKSVDVQVDHIQSAGTLTEYEHLPAFVERLFCEVDNLQVLCKPCHKAKTAEERLNVKNSIS
jgi:5-methylcytosine-specific restriction endonuclease McrA